MITRSEADSKVYSRCLRSRWTAVSQWKAHRTTVHAEIDPGHRARRPPGY